MELVIMGCALDLRFPEILNSFKLRIIELRGCKERSPHHLAGTVTVRA